MSIAFECRTLRARNAGPHQVLFGVPLFGRRFDWGKSSGAKQRWEEWSKEVGKEDGISSLRMLRGEESIPAWLDGQVRERSKKSGF